MTNSIDKTYRRESQLELLRIISMGMIIFQHTNFYSIGRPESLTFTSFLVCFTQSLATIGVNIFILITAWFGTRFTWNKIANIAWQCCFCVIPVSIILIATGIVNLNGFTQYFTYFWPFNYWYVVAYFGLLIFCPLLNNGIDAMSRKQHGLLILCVLAYVFLWDALLADQTVGMMGGYTAFWMITLYVIGRYLRKYPIRISNGLLVLIFVTSIIAKALLLFYHINGTRYTNPLVIIGAVSLFLLFTRFRFHNKLINLIASSMLMAYLLDMHPGIIALYRPYFIQIFNTESYISFLGTQCIFTMAFIILSIVYDRIRILMDPVPRIFEKINTLQR